MSIRYMSQVWDRGPDDPTQLLMLLALADAANEDGECWPSVATLARRARIKRRQAFYVLGQLEGSGYIKRQRRSHRSSVYRLLL